MKLLSTLSLFFFSSIIYAQYDGKVTSGIVEYDNESYEKSIGYLQEAINHKDELNEKNVAKAFFYLGSAHYALARNSASLEDFSNPSHATEAYRAFDAVIATEEKKWAKKVDDILPGLDQVLLLYAYKYISEKDYTNASPLLESSVSINAKVDKPNWLSFDFYGQAFLQTGDSTQALEYFKKAINTYKNHANDKPDASIAYTYLRASVVILNLENNVDAALKHLEQGLAVLETERSKLSSTKGLTPEYQNKFLTEWYPAAKQDLENSKLNILLQHPDKLDQALKEFETAVNNDPDNYQLWMAYAQLMEEKNIDKAADIYIKAIKINPSEFMGHYNLAALYINEGNRMYNMAAATHDKATSTQLKKRATIFYEEGYKQLISCITIDQNNKTVLEYLVTISERLEKTADHQKYSEALNKL